jgi:membrane protein DedA with SNARE-associated domain
MLAIAAIFSLSSNLGYVLPALIGLESMGVPSPGETALVLAAVLASQGKLQIWLVILIAIASAIVGDNLGYFLGRMIGRDVLTAPGPFQKRRITAIDVGDRFFQKHGGKAVFIGRWIALVRFATAWLAGINEMKFIHFFLWNAAGGITWAITYGLVGYYGGKAAGNLLAKVGIAGAILLGVAVVGGLGYVKLREHRAAQAAERRAAQSDGESPEPSGSSSSAHELMQ